MNLQILKHNPPKDKSPYKISLLQNIYCEKKEYTKTKQKTAIAIAGKRINHRLSRRVQRNTISQDTQQHPTTTNHHQYPQTRFEKRGTTLTRRSGKQVPLCVRATCRSGNRDTTIACDSQTGKRWQRQLCSP